MKIRLKALNIIYITKFKNNNRFKIQIIIYQINLEVITKSPT
jgi:hypothetical protein